jgi:TPR repeat protein
MRVHILCGLMIATLALVVSNGVAFAGPLEDAQLAYYHGDYETALRLFRPLAEQGNAVAQRDVGMMYASGWGVRQDDKEAVKWYRLAADRGDASAQADLGRMYAYGLGVPKDYDEAVKWFRLAAARENAAAQNHLGWMYQNGWGVPKD